MRLELRSVSVDLPGRPGALDGVDLSAKGGELLGLLGPNGAGKSTLLRLAAGLLHPSRGAVAVDGVSLADLSRKEVAKRIAFLPQENHADLPFTAVEVVLMGRSPHLGSLGLDGPADREIARASLAEAEASALADRPFHRLSGGERQRVLLARALAQRAPIWLWDEPTTHLDLSHQRLALHLARAHAGRGGLVIVSLHDLAQAAQVCDRVALLHQGRILEVGPPVEALTPTALQACFDVPFFADAEGDVRFVPNWQKR